MQLIHDIVVLETNDGSLFYYTYICMYGHNNFPEYDSMHYVPLSWYYLSYPKRNSEWTLFIICITILINYLKRSFLAFISKYGEPQSAYGLFVARKVGVMNKALQQSWIAYTYGDNIDTKICYTISKYE